ncbi:hypothetical protein BDV95DRAFT_612501 [Massariosphaeria phaeospora]|uniref:Uncharacterized protein n=1 Tax=Massariosphaeria phaeospora TaxID=100035 RepID=A0A7C8I0D4_9PLEO|nr:hypothetical protein BDV95DRAFT_612501 [Massariosphaeria phaeospora]
MLVASWILIASLLSLYTRVQRKSHSSSKGNSRTEEEISMRTRVKQLTSQIEEMKAEDLKNQQRIDATTTEPKKWTSMRMRQIEKLNAENLQNQQRMGVRKTESTDKILMRTQIKRLKSQIEQMKAEDLKNQQRINAMNKESKDIEWKLDQLVFIFELEDKTVSTRYPNVVEDVEDRVFRHLYSRVRDVRAMVIHTLLQYDNVAVENMT